MVSYKCFAKPLSRLDNEQSVRGSLLQKHGTIVHQTHDRLSRAGGACPIQQKCFLAVQKYCDNENNVEFNCQDIHDLQRNCRLNNYARFEIHRKKSQNFFSEFCTALSVLGWQVASDFSLKASFIHKPVQNDDGQKSDGDRLIQFDADVYQTALVQFMLMSRSAIVHTSTPSTVCAYQTISHYHCASRMVKFAIL